MLNGLAPGTQVIPFSAMIALRPIRLQLLRFRQVVALCEFWATVTSVHWTALCPNDQTNHDQT